MSTDRRPYDNCYWVRPGKFLAGEYPGSSDRWVAREKIYSQLDAGIDAFLDLTEPGELDSYEDILMEAAENAGVLVNYQRYPIQDVSVPRERKDMIAILDRIDHCLDIGQTVYVHCWGGVGRTGTVVGCYLVRHGLSGEEALERLRELWSTVSPDKLARRPISPETGPQGDWVRSWGATGES